MKSCYLIPWNSLNKSNVPHSFISVLPTPKVSNKNYLWNFDYIWYQPHVWFWIQPIGIAISKTFAKKNAYVADFIRNLINKSSL